MCCTLPKAAQAPGHAGSVAASSAPARVAVPLRAQRAPTLLQPINPPAPPAAAVAPCAAANFRAAATWLAGAAWACKVRWQFARLWHTAKGMRLVGTAQTDARSPVSPTASQQLQPPCAVGCSSTCQLCPRMAPAACGGGSDQPARNLVVCLPTRRTCPCCPCSCPVCSCCFLPCRSSRSPAPGSRRFHRGILLTCNNWLLLFPHSPTSYLAVDAGNAVHQAFGG